MARPQPGEVRAMLRELRLSLGSEKALCDALAIPYRTMVAWMLGTADPPAAAVRAVWLTWVLLCHPERVQTLFDLATWGRFRPVQIRRPKRSRAKSFAVLMQPDLMNGDGI